MNGKLAIQIRKLCDQIAREFHPERIILFGSHASGHARPESDVDLLVIMPAGRAHVATLLAQIDLVGGAGIGVRRRSSREERRGEAERAQRRAEAERVTGDHRNHPDRLSGPSVPLAESAAESSMSLNR